MNPFFWVLIGISYCSSLLLGIIIIIIIIYLILRIKLCWCDLYPLFLVFSMWTLGRDSFHPIRSLPLRAGILWWSPSTPQTFSREKRPNSFTHSKFSSPLVLFGPSLVLSASSWVMVIRTEHSTPGVALTSAEWDDHISVSTGDASVDAAQDVICLCCSKAPQACVQLLVYQDPEVLFSETAPQPQRSQLVWLFHPGAGPFSCLLLN